MTSVDCICGKPGDKKCSKCKIACYCSRECQIVDFPKHKKVCKFLTNVIEKETAENTSANILLLPAMCARAPIPKLPPSSPVFALEHLLPFFLMMATSHLQCNMVNWYSPVHEVLQTNNMLTIVSLDANMGPKTEFHTPTLFKDFYRGATDSGSAELAKTAFLTLAFFAKCNTMCCCFSQLLFELVQSHVMTYGGELVVGWALQDGYIDIAHPSITKFEVVNLQKEQDLTIVRDCITKGQPLPPSTKPEKMQRNSIHVWLTFVTESGRIFDLDLSALQFGTAHLPFPCVVPVTSATVQTTFAGICTRHRILSTSLSELHATVEDMKKQYIKGCNAGLPDRLIAASVDMLNLMFADVNSKILIHADTALPEYAADPAGHFWNRLRDLGREREDS